MNIHKIFDDDVIIVTSSVMSCRLHIACLTGDCGTTEVRHITTPALQFGLGPQLLSSFWANEKMLGGQKFISVTEVQSVIRQWLGQQPASFFASGIQKLFDRWDKCLNKLGLYI